MKTLLRRNHIVHTLLLLTLLVAAFLRLWQLADFPPSVSGDEADNGLEALLLMAYPTLIAFAPSNLGREALFHYLLMGPLAIFGPTIFALRLLPALAGLLGVALSYRWVRALLPEPARAAWVALLTAVFLATSLWALQLSRLGLRGILLLPTMVAAYYFFWLGYQRRAYGWFALSGLSLGLAAHTYTASRSLPLAFILFVLLLSLLYRRQAAGRLKLIWLGLVVTGLVALLIFAPLGWYFAHNPGAFIFRSDQVDLRSTYLALHAHTGESFGHFLWRSWGEHLVWFGRLVTPWVDTPGWPWWLRLLPYLFWLGLFRAGYLARRYEGYGLLLISFFLGLLPILLGLPTSMRVILAMPATYALLALGAYYPLELLGRFRQSWRPLLPALGVTALLLASSLSAASLFQPQRWVGLPPLPTLLDQAFDTAAKEIRYQVLDQGQSVLVPQALYGFPPAQFVLRQDFGPPLPVGDPGRLAPTEQVTLFWPADWARWFEGKRPSLVLLGPGQGERRGYVEAVGHWEPARWPEFEQAIQTQAGRDIVTDPVTGQPVGYLVELGRAQVLDALRSIPEQQVELQFGPEIDLLGYDAVFLTEERLDVGLFWRARRNILTDHHFLLQLFDQQGQLRGETFGTFNNPTAAWVPGQMIIDHQLIRLARPPEPGLYLLKVGLIRDDYQTQIRSTRGSWLPVSRPGGLSLPEPVAPLGFIPVGEWSRPEPVEPITFDHNIELTGYRLEAGPGPERLRVSLRWQARQPLAQDYTVTLQVLDEAGQLVAQVDKPPLGGAYPTRSWAPGQPLVDSYELQLPQPLPAGTYRLAVGLYELESLRRLPVTEAQVVIPGADLAVLQALPVGLAEE